MDNILLISASPRKEGNCAHITKHLHTSLNKARVLFLSDYAILPCIDCNACKNNDKEHNFCIQDTKEQNNAKELYTAISEAQTIIFISPIYFYHAPSQLKAFIDRAQRYWFLQKEEEKNKNIYAIYAAGRKKGEKIPDGIDLSLKYFAPLIQATFIKSLCLYGLENKNDFKNSANAQEKLDIFIDYCKNPQKTQEKIFFFSQIIDFFKQKRCLNCKKVYSANAYKLANTKEIHALCPHCATSLTRLTKGYCIKCGTLQDSSLANEVLNSCAICEESPVPWEDLRFFASYEDTLKDIIRYAKFHNKFIYTKTLADIILPLIQEFDNFDFIVPIPMHVNKLRQRGYNQCIELCKHLKLQANIPYENNALIKHKETLAQSGLDRKERLKNIKNCFTANKTKVEGKTILLLDDVATTGSTLREASNCLLKAGAKKVYIIYIAGVKL